MRQWGNLYFVFVNDIIIAGMRNTQKDKRIFAAVKDFYGPGIPKDVSIPKIALHITGRKSMPLNEELKRDIFLIKENMKDSIYMESFA